MDIDLSKVPPSERINLPAGALRAAHQRRVDELVELYAKAKEDAVILPFTLIYHSPPHHR